MSIPLNRKCDHEENRLKVCAPCGQKLALGTKKIDSFKISDKFEKLIKKWINDKFDLLNSKYPASICTTCRHTLSEFERGCQKRPLPKMPAYETLYLPKNTRMRSKFPGSPVCNCYICVTGRATLHKKQKKGRGICRNFDVDITEATGMYGALEIDKTGKNNVGREKSTESGNNNMVVCNICFQEVGRGKPHSCIAREDRPGNVIAKNLISTIQRLPDKQQDQIASSILREKIDELPSTSKNISNIEVKLATGGRPFRVLVNPCEKSNPVFSSERLDNLQVNTGASSRQMTKITNFIRSVAGRKSVPSHHSKHMTENSKLLLNIYHQDQVEFDVENSGAKEKRTVIWANAEELIESVVEKRELEGFYLIKVMADGGQGFFKVSLTILPANDDLAYDCNFGEDMPAKRSKYAEGGMVGKSANWTSVQKLIMLATVPRIKETYENLKVLFDLTQLNNVPFKFVADFKLLLIVNGQQTATSTYPCPYCFVTLGELRDRDPEQRNMMPCPDILKTYGHLKDDHSRFCADGKKKKLARYSNSTVNPPLFRESDDLTVLEKCVPPELHLLQGFVNHLFWSGLVPILGRERALLWPKKLNIISKGYHGEVFEGNACRRLLKEADRLNDAEIYQECGYFRIVPFISAFKTMDNLVQSCFRVARGDCDVEKLVGDLQKAVESTGVAITLKLHVILTHLKESLEFLDANTGLGLWSEQAGESVHHEFLKYWDRYKVNAIDAPSYGEKLRTAVAEFSSLHI